MADCDTVRITLIATGFEDRQAYLDQPARRAKPQQPNRERIYRLAEADAPAPASNPSRQPKSSPVLPEDDWEGESSIIRFLRER